MVKTAFKKQQQHNDRVKEKKQHETKPVYTKTTQYCYIAIGFHVCKSVFL